MNERDTTYLLRLKAGRIDLHERPCLMGIVNVTPDSFSDGGSFYSADAAVEHGLRLIGEGADILDIGGESTRPGASVVPEDEELRRVLPVIEKLRSASVIPISIDTRNAAVAAAAIAAGADIVNDVSALRHDPRMIDVVADAAVPLILMHMLGTPATMQDTPVYMDVVSDIHDFFVERLRCCSDRGIRNVLIDPGIGFGKTLAHNLTLIANLQGLLDLGVPILVGASRKSFIGQVTGLPADRRVPGSIAAAVLALRNGAAMFRVHDVCEHRSALDVAAAIIKAEESIHAG